MATFSIASEKVVELCTKAREELDRREAPKPNLFVQPDRSSRNALDVLEYAARRAMKLADGASSHVLIEAEHEHALQELLRPQR